MTGTEDLIEINIEGEKKTFELLHKEEFSSARKRMSIMVTNTETAETVLYMKGADSVIKELLKKDGTPQT